MNAVYSFVYIVVREVKKKVKNTKFYQSLDSKTQKSLISRGNLRGINRCLKTIDKKGYDEWFINTNTSIKNIRLIKEIITAET